MKRTDEITNSADVIDSRDIIARIEELQDQFDTLTTAAIDVETDEEKDNPREALADWLGTDSGNLPDDLSNITVDLLQFANSDESNELVELKKLASQCDGYGDWHHGETLIRDSYFTEYAQQFAEDIGSIDRNAAWPACHIDWEAAADALKMDYTEVDFGGVTYQMRA